LLLHRQLVQLCSIRPQQLLGLYVSAALGLKKGRPAEAIHGVHIGVVIDQHLSYGNILAPTHGHVQGTTLFVVAEVGIHACKQQSLDLFQAALRNRKEEVYALRARLSLGRIDGH
jgi:hypothetical protein